MMHATTPESDVLLAYEMNGRVRVPRCFNIYFLATFLIFLDPLISFQVFEVKTYDFVHLK
jgi:hypothetical protein